MTNNELGNNLKAIRKSYNMSQRAFGEILGVCNQTVSFWEAGSREPDLDMLVRISKKFDVSTDFLLDNEKIDGMLRK